MADIPTVAQAIATRLAAAPLNMRVEPYLGDQVNPPVALVAIETHNPHAAFGRERLYHFTVFLILPRTADRAQLEALEQYMSATGNLSIVNQLEADQTLGGTTHTVLVLSVGPPATVQINQNPYIGCPFTVEVRTSD